jgi:hypothetical protein
VQGTGFSEVVAGLESELKAVRARNGALGEDNRGCYAQIRAKDKQLAAYEAAMAEARAIAVENGVRISCSGSQPNLALLESTAVNTPMRA